MDAKLTVKQNERHKTIVEIAPNIRCGAREILVVGGPCSVETREQMEMVASQLSGSVQVLRGGVHKPRTSPYSFQGLGTDGLEILVESARKSDLPVVTEAMDEDQLSELAPFVQAVQIGSRNMQNFQLLRAAGRCGRPVILKRGLAATIEEFILAAEYVMLAGNHNVILCERGIRSFDTYTRNVLDLGAVAALKQLTHLPVIVDPSHASGKRELVADLARAAIAVGADGVMIECHPNPEKSISDARQAISLNDMVSLVDSLRHIADAVGRRVISRSIGQPHHAPKHELVA